MSWIELYAAWKIVGGVLIVLIFLSILGVAKFLDWMEGKRR
ncbi:hypothetical protein SAMN05216312_102177 [Cohnella sp. OV330]|nr:hypothetical protein SAMN05216312_102177 [Cohnella sp. OV330]